MMKEAKEYIIFECFLCEKKFLANEEEYHVQNGFIVCQECYWDYYNRE